MVVGVCTVPPEGMGWDGIPCVGESGEWGAHVAGGVENGLPGYCTKSVGKVEMENGVVRMGMESA